MTHIERLTLTLQAECLFSKWGFGDGGQVGEWLMDHDLVSVERYMALDDNAVLVDLVKSHLLPALDAAGFLYSVYVLETSHNPIRVNRWGSKDWDDHTIDAPIEVMGMCVDVSINEVMEACAPHA